MNHANRLKNLDLTNLSLEEGTFQRLQALTSEDWIDAGHFNLQTITCLTSVLQRFRRDQLFRIARALRATRYKNAWPTLAADRDTLAAAIAAHVYSKFYRRIHQRAKPESVAKREKDCWGNIAWQQAKPAGIKGMEDAESVARKEARKAQALEEKHQQMIEEHGAATVAAVHDYTPEGKKELDMAAKAQKKAKKKTAKKAGKKTEKKATAKAPAKPKADKKKSGLDYAAEALRRSSKPLNAKTIAERAITAGWVTNGKTPHATLYAAMLREVAAKGSASRFRKVDRGLFELNTAAKIA